MRTGVVILFLVCLGATLAQQDEPVVTDDEFGREVTLYKIQQDKFCWRRQYLRLPGEVCRNNFSSKGPLCVQICKDANPISCGVACAKDRRACFMGYVKMLTSVALMVVKLTMAVVTGGQNFIIVTGINAIKALFMLARTFKKFGISKQNFFKFIVGKADKENILINPRTVSEIWEEASDVTKTQMTLEAISKVDPTGIIQTVNAFVHEVCVENN